jgi:hypothetical protein
MAGAISSGQFAASAVTVSKESAEPCASLDCVRRAGSNDQQVHSVTEPDVQDVRLVAPQVRIDEGASAGDRLKSKGCDELFSRA